MNEDNQPERYVIPSMTFITPCASITPGFFPEEWHKRYAAVTSPLPLKGGSAMRTTETGAINLTQRLLADAPWMAAA